MLYNIYRNINILNKFYIYTNYASNNTANNNYTIQTFSLSYANTKCFYSPYSLSQVVEQSEIMPNLEEILLPVAVSNFKQFFKNVSIATPQQLNKTPSLHRLKGLTTLRRLTTYITRGGHFYKTMQVILNAFSTLDNNLKII